MCVFVCDGAALNKHHRESAASAAGVDRKETDSIQNQPPPSPPAPPDSFICSCCGSYGLVHVDLWAAEG